MMSTQETLSSVSLDLFMRWGYLHDMERWLMTQLNKDRGWESEGGGEVNGEEEEGGYVALWQWQGARGHLCFL